MGTDRSAFRNYWNAYGGAKAILKSGYFQAAVLLTALTYPWWATAEWWERVLNIEPSMLGFSLGGYVMLLAVGSERFMELLARAGGDGVAALASISAAFVHFIVVQFSALILALLFVATQETIWVSGGWKFNVLPHIFRTAQETIAIVAFFYSLTTGIAATIRIYSLTNLYVAMVRSSREQAAGTRNDPIYVRIMEETDRPRNRDTKPPTD